MRESQSYRLMPLVLGDFDGSNEAFVVLVPKLVVLRSALGVPKSEDCELGVFRNPLRLSVADLLVVLVPEPPVKGICSDEVVPNPTQGIPVRFEEA